MCRFVLRPSSHEAYNSKCCDHECIFCCRQVLLPSLRYFSIHYHIHSQVLRGALHHPPQSCLPRRFLADLDARLPALAPPLCCSHSFPLHHLHSPRVCVGTGPLLRSLGPRLGLSLDTLARASSWFLSQERPPHLSHNTQSPRSCTAAQSRQHDRRWLPSRLAKAVSLPACHVDWRPASSPLGPPLRLRLGRPPTQQHYAGTVHGGFCDVQSSHVLCLRGLRSSYPYLYTDERRRHARRCVAYPNDRYRRTQEATHPRRPEAERASGKLSCSRGGRHLAASTTHAQGSENARRRLQGKRLW